MGERDYASVADALGELVEGGLARGINATSAASRAWWLANGDFEHRHTCGVFLKDLSDLDRAPALYVYLDTSSILQDFTTNREVYLARLENVGFEVSDVQFRLSRRPRRPRAGEAGAAVPGAAGTAAAPPRERAVTPDDERRAREAVADLPDGLRERVADAMLSSISKQRRKDTENRTTAR